MGLCSYHCAQALHIRGWRYIICIGIDVSEFPLHALAAIPMRKAPAPIQQDANCFPEVICPLEKRKNSCLLLVLRHDTLVPSLYPTPGVQKFSKNLGATSKV